MDERTADLLARTPWDALNANPARLGTGVPDAIRQLLGATTDGAAETAYWKLDFNVVVHGRLYDSALALVPVLLSILAHPLNPHARRYVARLVAQIADGESHEHERHAGRTALGDECRAALREGFELIRALTADPDPDVRRSAADAIEALEEDRSPPEPDDLGAPDDPDDPLDIAASAWFCRDRTERERAFRRALELADGASGAWSEQWVADARARALLGLADLGAAPLAEALAAVDRAVEVDAGCVALQTLTEMHYAAGRFDDARATIVRLPRWCFRTRESFDRRFVLWTLRACCCFELGLMAEGFRYAGAITRKMALPDDPFELTWYPPRRLVDALLAMPDEPRAGAMLRAMAAIPHLDEYFDADVLARVRAAAR